jgi:hypothetical protein
MPDILGSLRNMNRNQTISNPTNINTNPVIRSAGMFLMPQNQNEQLPINKPTIEEDQPEQDSTNFLGSLLAQGVASLGAGIQGGDIAQVGRSFETGRQRAEQDRKAKALIDPKSEESKRRRMVFEKALGSSIPEEYSATDLNDPVVLQSIRDKKMPTLAPKSMASSGSPKQQGIEKSPFYKDIVITNNMSRSVERDMKELIDLVNRSGNTPLAGADKFRKDQLVGKIAINYNKILDPSSIVKPEEAEAIVKQLGLDWMTRDNVTKESLQQFQKGVGAEASDRIKGYYGMYTTFDPTEQQIYDDYKKNPNDTKLKQAFENILYLKRTK